MLITIPSLLIMDYLPPVPGPKLAKFRGKDGPLNIDFIQYLGSGVHAHVWKVCMDGNIYALKMVRAY